MEDERVELPSDPLSSTSPSGPMLLVPEPAPPPTLSRVSVDGSGPKKDTVNPVSLYEFETPALALKNNTDWLVLKQSLVMLEAQRNVAIQHLDKLKEAEANLLRDPEDFVAKLSTGKIQLPSRQKIVELPVIDWTKYTNDINFNFTSRHAYRLQRQLVQGDDGSEASDSQYPVQSVSGMVVVRGRVKDDSKSATFNQLWTPEEQEKLERLLVKYPSEPVEAKRWKKIADDLGNRTVAQVASRVQKYFIKLAKNNLPIPGRMPNLGSSKKSGQKHRNHHLFMQQESTFLHSYQPVNLPDDDSDDNTSPHCAPDDDGIIIVSDEEEVPEYQRNSLCYRQILKLKQLKRLKQIQHVGFACDSCGADPIVGNRWHCSDCPPGVSTDLCENCVESSFESETHNSSHRLKPLRTPPDSTVDRDYQSVTRIDNYLDPNFVPYG